MQRAVVSLTPHPVVGHILRGIAHGAPEENVPLSKEIHLTSTLSS